MRRRTKQERDPRDLFRQKSLTPDQEQKLRGAGHKQDEDEGLDPGVILARKYGPERRTIEQISNHGRPVSQERARLVLECLNLGLDDEECRLLLGTDAWRAFKTAANNEKEKLWKSFQDKYPKPQSNERYLYERTD